MLGSVVWSRKNKWTFLLVKINFHGYSMNVIWLCAVELSLLERDTASCTIHTKALTRILSTCILMTNKALLHQKDNKTRLNV
eukprot:snap_masked-scaffold_7-processed-gene-10.61-mRNA-1 protein AED:1.00 eAED:1.00 QI:0/0/0/0/1/1/2/0/81